MTGRAGRRVLGSSSCRSAAPLASHPERPAGTTLTSERIHGLRLALRTARCAARQRTFARLDAQAAVRGPGSAAPRHCAGGLRPKPPGAAPAPPATATPDRACPARRRVDPAGGEYRSGGARAARSDPWPRLGLRRARSPARCSAFTGRQPRPDRGRQLGTLQAQPPQPRQRLREQGGAARGRRAVVQQPEGVQVP